MKEAELLSGRVGWACRLRFSCRSRCPEGQVEGRKPGLKDLGLRLKGEKTDLVRLGLLELRDTDVDTAARKLTVGQERQATRVVLIRAADGVFNAQRLAGDGKPRREAAGRPRRAAGPAEARRQAADAAPACRGEARGAGRLGPARRGIARWRRPSCQRRAAHAGGRGPVDGQGQQGPVDLQAGINKRGQFGIRGAVGLRAAGGQPRRDLGRRHHDAAAPRHRAGEDRDHPRQAHPRGKLAFELPPSRWPPGPASGEPDPWATSPRWTSSTPPTSLKWKSLYFGGVDLRLAPLAVSIDDIALTDFYTRLILDAQGGLNIREITAQRANEAKAAVRRPR